MGNSYQKRIAELERLEKENREKERKTAESPSLDLHELDIVAHFLENFSDPDPNLQYEDSTDRMLRRFQQALESHHFHQQLLVSQTVLRIRQRLENPIRPENGLMEMLVRYSGDIDIEEV